MDEFIAGESTNSGAVTPVANPNSSSLDQKQKIGLWVLLFLVFFIILFWYISLRVYITKSLYGDYNPAELRLDQANQQKLLENQARLDDVYSIDTDGDGISDWEESNVYGTSAYLVDSDGDGINDKDEVNAGTNPTCPEGKQCTGSMVNDLTPTNSSNSSVISGEAVTATQSELMKQAFGEKPDPEFLRGHLLSAATDAEQKTVIQNLTDEQILEFYQQLVGSDALTATSSEVINNQQ